MSLPFCAASFKSQLKTTLFLSAYGSTPYSMVQSHPALLIQFILSTPALYKFLLYCTVQTESGPTGSL